MSSYRWPRRTGGLRGSSPMERMLVVTSWGGSNPCAEAGTGAKAAAAKMRQSANLLFTDCLPKNGVLTIGPIGARLRRSLRHAYAQFGDQPCNHHCAGRPVHVPLCFLEQGRATWRPPVSLRKLTSAFRTVILSYCSAVVRWP